MEKEKIQYLSVVLCTFNDEKYIRYSIESILKQTYPYFEFIIVNDGSTDKTLEIIKEFNDDRIIIIDKPNTGLADSLNIGISHAQYEWIARMDADDISLPTRFETQIRYIQSNVAVIGGQYIGISEDNELLSFRHLPTKHWQIKFYLSLGISKVVHPSVLINKHILSRVSGYDVNFGAAQDLDLWLRIIKNYRIINAKEVIIKYRDNSRGISKRTPVKQFTNAMIALIKYYNSLCILTPEKYNAIKQQLHLSDSWHNILNCNDSLQSIKSKLIYRLKIMYIIIARLSLSKKIIVNP